MPPLLNYLATLNWFHLLIVLHSTSRPMSVRELSELSGISLGGTCDILDRLTAGGLVRRFTKHGRPAFELILEEEDCALLKKAAALKSEAWLKQRADKFSKKRQAALGWIGQAGELVKHGKQKRQKSV